MTFSDADIGELIEFYNAFILMKYKPYSMNQNSMQIEGSKDTKHSRNTGYRTYYKNEECTYCS